MDAADRILKQGFEDDLPAIIKIMHKQHQTILFSATTTKNVDELARTAIDKNAVYVEVPNDTNLATAEGLEQGYVIVPSLIKVPCYSFLRSETEIVWDDGQLFGQLVTKDIGSLACS